MLIDTHCHINMMVKQKFDIPLNENNFVAVASIIEQAYQNNITHIINVGTSLIESKNCVLLAQYSSYIWASVGIHPNDCTDNWRSDLAIIKMMLKNTKNRIVAIGECGLDYHYPGYNKQRQYDAFRMQIDLALEYDLALIVHTRDASDDTARILELYKNSMPRGVIHCFSEDQHFANYVIELGFMIGLGGTITYPKNEYLRTIAKTVSLSTILLETDAPFLPPQNIRGKQNHPQEIKNIANYLAELRHESLETISYQTTQNAKKIFIF